ncbi:MULTISPECIES: molybdopterin molybdotransferase MoeA [Saccharothrix]|uniref:molybdopterin molybdotransferase MoeA n=1 Tax=Saccharothrix TaxID=2071 RepID=UPI00093F5911|nr:molybdopterin-binding protein [Saccharothrix sp. CB00851]OKI22289.1 molybdopterin molybdenumtransferase MoeA [Saccharothrix sp. CB00851]
MRIPWTEARQAARHAGKPLDVVELPLARASGAVLAAPLPALAAVPSFDNSAMDGYAVAGRGPWTVVGRVRAGGVAGSLHAGQAVEIATGAPVPSGADAVLPVEHAEAVGALVSGDVELGRHIRRVGESCPAGVPLLPAGAVVTPAVLGLAASVGHDALAVHRRPRVAAVLTGDQVVTAGVPGPGRVRDAIGPVLPGLVGAAGGELAGVTYLVDHPGALVEALWEVDADVVVVGGATSVGPADHLREALRVLHADVRVDGVACRPGHPQVLAVLPDGRCVVGLPGNPFAALAAGVTLLAPLLETLSGREPGRPWTVGLAAVRSHGHDTRLVPVVVSGSVGVAVGHDQPGTLWGAALADALAVVPPGFGGGEVEVLPVAGGSGGVQF